MRNHEKIREKAETLKRRKEIIEPIFGTVKRNLGFRRWSVRGLKKVQAEWAVVCTAVNLRKIYKYLKNNGFPDVGFRVPLQKGIGEELMIGTNA